LNNEQNKSQIKKAMDYSIALFEFKAWFNLWRFAPELSKAWKYGTAWTWLEQL